jgi:hypothetical protein
VDAIGIVSSGGPQMIVNDGYLICSDLRQGLSEEAVAEMFWHNSISNQGLASRWSRLVARSSQLLWICATSG